VGRRRTVCIYVDSELVEEAAKAAEAQGVSLSGLVEEALRLYVAYVLRRPEPRRGRAKKADREAPTGNAHREAFPAGSSLQGASSPPPSPPPPPSTPQLPPHLQNNAWVAVLRSRR